MAKGSTVIVIAVLVLAVIGSCLIIPKCGAVTSSLTIQVSSQLTNQPIPDAHVSITGPISDSASTNINGTITFNNIPSGNYSILVSVQDFKNTAQQQITVNGTTTTLVLFAYTTAHFTYSPSQPLINRTVAFNASQSKSSANITGYIWDFGDGSSGSGKIINHVFAKPGNYTVFLEVTSEVGSAAYNQLVIVTVPVENDFLWFLLLIPLFLLIPLLIFWRRRRYYVVIQARVPVYRNNPHCPGDGTKCEDCKLTPC
jgi:PKD repeat protein